ncbi:uncharacterized protein LOC144887611 isoform X2 [Branchiostoma floridae x Branchiostoma japonicum]
MWGKWALMFCVVATLSDAEQITHINNKTCPVDVMFLLDGSWSMGSQIYQEEKEYVVNVVKCLSIKNFTVGVIGYASIATMKLPLWDHGNIVDFQDLIRDIDFTGGLKRTGGAIEYMIAVTKFRAGARKVVVVVTDGSLQDPFYFADRAFADYASKVNRAGIDLYAVTAGREGFINDEVHRILTGDNSRVVSMTQNPPWDLSSRIELCECPCAQICTYTNFKTGHFQCSCRKGFKLNSDGLTCDDIDECETNNGGCAQVCSNFDGGFECSCGKFFKLNSDGLTCDESALPDLGHLISGKVRDVYTIYMEDLVENWRSCEAHMELNGCRLDITYPSPEERYPPTVGQLLLALLPHLDISDLENYMGYDTAHLLVHTVDVHSSYVDRCSRTLHILGRADNIFLPIFLPSFHAVSVNVTYTVPLITFLPIRLAVLLGSFHNTILFNVVFFIGDIYFTVAFESFDIGNVGHGKAESKDVTIGRLISGLNSFLLTNGVHIPTLFHLIKLEGNYYVPDINIQVVTQHGGYSLELDFKTNILDSQVFFFLSSAESDDGSTIQSYSLGMTVKSVRFGDLIHDVVNDHVIVPFISDLLISEAALLATTSPQEANYPIPLLNVVAAEISSGLGVAYKMKLSDDVPLGTFFLGVDGSTFKFKVLSEDRIPVSALVGNVIASSSPIGLPSHLSVADILAGSLKSFEYNADNNDLTVSVVIEDTVTTVTFAM